MKTIITTILLSIIFFVNSFAKEIFLVDTPKCQIFLDDSKKSDIYLRGYCNLKNNFTVIDGIKSSYEYKKVPKLLSVLARNKAISIKYNAQNLIAYPVSKTKTLHLLSTTPKYKTVKIKDKKYMFISYISKYNSHKYGVKKDSYEAKYDLIVLQKYDEQISKKRDELINSIPRKISVKEIFTPVTFRYILADALSSKSPARKIKTQDILELMFKEQSYAEIIKKFKDTPDYLKDSNIFINLFQSSKFLQRVSIQERLKIIKEMKNSLHVESSYQVFTLYGALSHGYSFNDTKKEMRLEIEAIEYFTQHYDEYKDLIINNSNDTAHIQPDIYAELLISEFKNSAKDKILLQMYIQSLRTFSKLTQKDITNYSLARLVLTMSDKQIEHIKPRLQRFYEQKLKENKKENFYLYISNWKDRKYITIHIKIDAKNTKNILKTLEEDSTFAHMNSEFSKTITKDMSKDEIIQKVAYRYGLKDAKYEVYKTEIKIKNREIE